MSRIKVTVCYHPKGGELVCLPATLPPGATLERAILASGVVGHFPEIDLSTAKVGVYSETLPLSAPVENGDRVEIYRPLPNQNKRSLR